MERNYAGDLARKHLIARAYKETRDMPFEVNLEARGYEENIAHTKIHQRGSCSPKHYLLGSACKKMQARVVYLTFPFRWNDLKVDYPLEVRKLAEKMPLSYHLALSVSIGQESFFLDATWDIPLEKAGFPVNKMENGLGNTINAVIPCGDTVKHQNHIERERYLRTTANKATRLDIKFQFYTGLNKWLETVRKT